LDFPTLLLCNFGTFLLCNFPTSLLSPIIKLNTLYIVYKQKNFSSEKWFNSALWDVGQPGGFIFSTDLLSSREIETTCPSSIPEGRIKPFYFCEKENGKEENGFYPSIPVEFRLSVMTRQLARINSANTRLHSANTRLSHGPLNFKAIPLFTTVKIEAFMLHASLAAEHDGGCQFSGPWESLVLAG
jgi:hypothetical protein